MGMVILICCKFLFLKILLQTNETEPGDRRWKALSVLRHAFTQEDFGQSLVCRVNHPAYPNGFQEATTTLDLLCKINDNFHVLLFLM
jgi:hypothetical protein